MGSEMCIRDRSTCLCLRSRSSLIAAVVAAGAHLRSSGSWNRASISVVALRNGVAPEPALSLASADAGGGAVAVYEDDDVTSNRTVRQIEDRIRELERLLGRKTREAENLGEALDKSRSKKPTLLARSPLKDDFR